MRSSQRPSTASDAETTFSGALGTVRGRGGRRGAGGRRGSETAAPGVREAGRIVTAESARRRRRRVCVCVFACLLAHKRLCVSER